jgi:hypothetical protein
METLAPPGDGTLPPAEAGLKLRRRRSRIVLTALLAILVLSVAFAATYIARYRPLGDGSGSYSVYAPHIQRLGDFQSPQHKDAFTVFRVPYRFNETISYSYTLWNHGWRSIRVTAITEANTDVGPVRFSHVQMGPTHSPYSFDGVGPHAIAFHPFTLQPGGYRQVALLNRYRECGPSGKEGQDYIGIFPTMAVTYKAFGIAQHQTIQLPFEVRYLVSGCRTPF